MKLLFCLCLSTALVAQTSPTPSTSSNDSAAQTKADPGAAKARQLISQMIQALGGDTYLHIGDMEQEGRTNGFYHGRPTGGTAPFWRFYKFPDKERVELTKERDWIVIHNGGVGRKLLSTEPSQKTRTL